MKKVTMIMLLLVVTCSLFAQVEFDNALAIRQGTNIEWFRSSTSINEGIVYVWSDTRLGGRDLFAQLISPSGEKLWGENGLTVDNNVDRQEDPMIVTTSDNSVIIGYVCFADDPDGDIKAQKINASGQKLWGEHGVSICNANNVQISINMVPDNNGGAYIAWSDKRAGLDHIFAQHVNASGVVSWATNGINVDPTALNKGSNTFWEDEQGGAVMAFVRYPVPANGDIYMIRMTAADGIVWGPSPLIAQTGNQYNTKMAPDGAGGFIFAWESKSGDTASPQLRLQRIDLQGNLLWDSEGIIVSDHNRNQERHRLVEVSTGGAVLAWEDKRTPPHTNPDIYIQKFDLNGNQVWETGGISVYQSEHIQDNLRMSKTNDGGAVLVWEDSRNSTQNEKQIFAQKFNADGSNAWADGGIIIANTIGGQTGGNVKILGDLYNVVWADHRTGSLGLMTQFVNEQGNFILQNDGIEVFWGLSGNAESYVTLAHDDITYIVWLDSRHGLFGHKVYYQIIDAQGTPLMPFNGARVGLNPEDYVLEGNLYAKVNHNGDLLVAWTREENAYIVPYAQIINTQGQRLLGDYGIRLRDGANARNNEIMINWRNNGWELFWSENINVICTVGQRIENNQKVWGDHGKVIIRNYDEDWLQGTPTPPFAVFGDYLIYRSPNQGFENFFIVRLDHNGDIADGWPEFGKPVHNRPALQRRVKGLIHNNKIYVIWEELDASLNDCIFAAVLDLNGNPASDNYFVNLTPFENDQHNYSAYINNNYLVLNFEDFYTGVKKIVSQKYILENNTITPVWEETGKIVAVDDKAHFSPQATSMFERNLVVWSKRITPANAPEPDFDIFMAMQDENGAIIGTPEGLRVNNHAKEQKLPLLAKHNNYKVSVAWIDGISSGKEPIFGIYMQRVHTGAFTSNNDITFESTPAPLYAIGNYPNPFNPETKIAFTLNHNSNVSIEVFNVKGQKVKTLLNDHLEQGRHSILWNGTNENGKNVGSGLYFYKISTPEFSTTKKMMLLK